MVSIKRVYWDFFWLVIGVTDTHPGKAALGYIKKVHEQSMGKKGSKEHFFIVPAAIPALSSW